MFPGYQDQQLLEDHRSSASQCSCKPSTVSRPQLALSTPCRESYLASELSSCRCADFEVSTASYVALCFAKNRFSADRGILRTRTRRLLNFPGVPITMTPGKSPNWRRTMFRLTRSSFATSAGVRYSERCPEPCSLTSSLVWFISSFGVSREPCLASRRCAVRKLPASFWILFAV